MTRPVETPTDLVCAVGELVAEYPEVAGIGPIAWLAEAVRWGA